MGSNGPIKNKSHMLSLVCNLVNSAKKHFKNFMVTIMMAMNCR